MADWIMNVWYLAAFATEVGDAPLGRRLLDRPIVLFRDAEGRVAALEDRCPHRFARLSRGRVLQGELECPYHGLRFGADGVCAHSPFSEKPPRAVAAATFPVVERDLLIWFWPGDPALAATTPPPDLSYIYPRPDFRLNGTCLHQTSDFRLGFDNLMDISHAGWLHGNSLGRGTDIIEHQFRRGRYSYRTDGEAVFSIWHFAAADGTIDESDYLEMKWTPPGTIVSRSGSDETGRVVDHDWFSLHILTPETPTSCHYFTAEVYNDDLYPPDQVAARRAFLDQKVFIEEDNVMMDDIQAAIGERDLFDMSPALLPIDAAAVLVRRHYARRAAEERANAPALAAAE